MYRQLLAIPLLLAACGKAPSTDDTADTDTDVAVDTDSDVVVDTELPDPCTPPRFVDPPRGAYLIAPGWNTWARTANPSQACTPSDENCDDCVHGGEFLVAELITTCDCDMVRISDGLGAFDWSCSDPGGGRLELTTNGLDAGKGLADLIDPATGTWRPNTIRVKAGDHDVTSDPSTWWTTPTAAAPASGVLSAANTVYVAATDLETDFTVTADGVSLVVPDGTTQTGGGSTMLSADGVDRVWIEGTFDATGSSDGLLLTDVDLATLKNVSVTGPGQGNAPRGIALDGGLAARIDGTTVTDSLFTGISLRETDGACVRASAVVDAAGVGVSVVSSDNVAMANVGVAGSGDDGVYVDTCDSPDLRAISSADNDGDGLHVTDAPAAKLWDLRVSNNAGDGLRVAGVSSAVVVQNVLAAGNDGDGVAIDAADAMVAQITAAGNTGAGVRIAGDGTVLANVAAIRNTGSGVLLQGDAPTVVDLAASFNGQVGVKTVDADATFTGGLFLGANLAGACDDQDSGAGLTAACANEGASNATIDLTADASGSFVGGVVTDDLVNQADTDGEASYADVTEGAWLVFGNRERVWMDDGGLASPLQASPCASGDTCRITDWSVSALDTILLGLVPKPVGNDAVTHAFTPTTQVGCDAVPGATFSGGTCSATFLRGAIETLGDAFGDDDGLCGNTDSCVHTMNVGAYQGHGRLGGTGPFTDGTITGVTLRAYRTNGR